MITILGLPLWLWVVAAIGLQSAGGVLVPLNTRLKGGEAGYILEKSGARILCTVTEFLGTDYVGLLRDALGGPSSTRPKPLNKCIVCCSPI